MRRWFGDTDSESVGIFGNQSKDETVDNNYWSYCRRWVLGGENAGTAPVVASASTMAATPWYCWSFQ
jgi:hypothetical protein